MGLLWSLQFPDIILLIIMGMASLEGFAVPVLIADRVAINLNISNFSHLESHPCVNNNTHDEKLIQASAADWSMAYWLASSLPGVFTTLIIGGWSDRVGRRFPILLALGGYAFCAGCTLAVAYWELSLAVLIAGAAVEGLFGGYPTILLAVYAYTSDISKQEHRTVRLMLLMTVELVGGAGMQILGGYMLKARGVFPTECIVLGGHCLNLLYTGFLLAESRGKGSSIAGQHGADSSGEPKTPHQIDTVQNTSSYLYNIKKTYQLVLSPWPYRKQFVIIIIAFQIIVFNLSGADGLVSLYVMERPLCWASTITGYFFAARSAAMLLGVAVFAPLVKRLNIPDRYLVQAGILGIVLCFGIITISDKTYKMFAAASCMFLVGPCFSTMRSMLSKLVSSDDLGSMFALIASLELAVSVMSVLVYNNLYAYLVTNASIPFLPTAVCLCFLLAAITTIIPSILFCFVRERKDSEMELPNVAGAGANERAQLLENSGG